MSKLINILEAYENSLEESLQRLDESLLKSDFKFGFELEAIASENDFEFVSSRDNYSDDDYDEDEDDDYLDDDDENYSKRQEIAHVLIELFNKHIKGNMGEDGEIQTDGSIHPDESGDVPFEWASPVMTLVPDNIRGVIEFLKELPNVGIYTNSTCGFHHHVSWKGCTERDMIWTYMNLVNDKKFIKELSYFDSIDGSIFQLSDSSYASEDFDTIRKALKDGDYKTILNYCTDEKYRLFRIHPYGTIEWRGPRDFMNDRETECIKEFYLKKFYPFVSEIIKCEESKEINGVSRDKFFEELKKERKKHEFKKTDNMEFLHRVTGYRGDRQFRFKEFSDETTLSNRLLNAIQNKPEFFVRFMIELNGSNTVLIQPFVEHFKKDNSTLGRIFRRVNQTVNLDRNETVKKQFLEAVTKIIYERICEFDIILFEEIVGEKIIKLLNPEELFKESFNFIENELSPTDTGSKFANVDKTLNYLDVCEKYKLKLPYKSFKKIIHLIAYTNTVDNSRSLWFIGIIRRFYLIMSHAARLYLKNELRELIDIANIEPYLSGKKTAFMNIDSGVAIDIIKLAYTTKQAQHEWNKRIISAVYENPEMIGMFNLLFDTDDKDMFNAIVYLTSRYGDEEDVSNNGSLFVKVKRELV